MLRDFIFIHDWLTGLENKRIFKAFVEEEFIKGTTH